MAIFKQKKIKPALITTLILGITSILIVIINLIISFINSRLNSIPNIIAGILVFISSLIIRIFIIDKNLFNSFFKSNHPVLKYKSKINRHLDFMLLAMFTGVIATLVIQKFKIPGVFLYMLMHIFIILALLRIVCLKLKIVFKSIKSSLFYISIILFWVIVIFFIFFKFIYKEFYNLIVLPYLFCLSITVILSFAGLAYYKNFSIFRIIICLGSMLFLISDCIVGYVINVNNQSKLAFIIGPTYVFSILLLSFAPLAIKSQLMLLRIFGPKN